MEHQISNILFIPGINLGNWEREESCSIKSESDLIGSLIFSWMFLHCINIMQSAQNYTKQKIIEVLNLKYLQI